MVAPLIELWSFDTRYSISGVACLDILKDCLQRNAAVVPHLGLLDPSAFDSP